MNENANEGYIEEAVQQVQSNEESLELKSEEQNVENHPPLARRNFLKIGLGALSALAVLEMTGASLIFLRARSLEGEFGERITVGEVERFVPGTVTEIDAGNFFLVRAPDGGFLAVYRRCPHLGCTINWAAEQERFHCPCHASSFDMYGDFQGKAVDRALDSFAVSFKEGKVIVDTSQILSRERFTREQLSYAT